MKKRQKPIGVCTRCGSAIYNATLINQRCGRQVSGQRCRGVNSSALNENDWAECPECLGTGWQGSAGCDKCAGIGWLFERYTSGH